MPSVDIYGRVDHIRMTVYAITVPTITAGPTTTYASLTRTGPANAWGFTFTPHDDYHVDADGLTYSLRTSATYGTGTEITSGTCTSDVSKVLTGLAYNITGLADGSNSLFLHISNGTDNTATAGSVTLLRDDAAPTAATAISTSPSPVI